MKRTFDKTVIATCTRCHQQGWISTGNGLTRCTHLEIPAQVGAAEEFESAED
ncbi:hypothetical protein [Streptomyces sp. NPDC090445]|uniref:hypothetical protein n=1 Tax=Streptomyces sp. NPDC090445 TaxID=3365963 RepID=UPI003811BCBF